MQRYNVKLTEKSDDGLIDKKPDNKRPLTEEEKQLIDKFSGSVDRIIDEKAEKLEALDERYSGLN